MLVDEWISYEKRRGRSITTALNALEYHTGVPVEHGRLSRMRNHQRPVPPGVQDFILNRDAGQFLAELLEQHGAAVAPDTAAQVAKRLSPL